MQTPDPEACLEALEDFRRHERALHLLTEELHAIARGRDRCLADATQYALDCLESDLEPSPVEYATKAGIDRSAASRRLLKLREKLASRIKRCLDALSASPRRPR